MAIISIALCLQSKELPSLVKIMTFISPPNLRFEVLMHIQCEMNKTIWDLHLANECDVVSCEQLYPDARLQQYPVLSFA